MARVKANFTDEDLFVISFKSVPQLVGQPAVASTQTNPILASDTATQTASTSESGCQTDEPSQLGRGGSAAPVTSTDEEKGGQGEGKEGEMTASLPGLESMLHLVTPMMEKEVMFTVLCVHVLNLN
jgi:hypothetical protein